MSPEQLIDLRSVVDAERADIRTQLQQQHAPSEWRHRAKHALEAKVRLVTRISERLNEIKQARHKATMIAGMPGHLVFLHAFRRLAEHRLDEATYRQIAEEAAQAIGAPVVCDKCREGILAGATLRLMVAGAERGDGSESR
jgi:hypothetical protein